MGPDWGRKFLLSLGMTPRAKTTSRMATDSQIQDAGNALFKDLAAVQDQYNVPQDPHKRR